MKKAESFKLEKVWGYEEWIYSPLKDYETKYKDGSIAKNGPIIKIIYANDFLPIQVHPDDQTAQKIENERFGKSESWLILEATPDAKIGLNFKDNNEDVIIDFIKNKNLLDNMNMINVKENDFISVPAGMPHAMGGNIVALEVQQSSDITYRYFDFNRKNEFDEPRRNIDFDKIFLAQKNVEYFKEKVNFDENVFNTDQGKQIYSSRKIKLIKEAIVVDIISRSAYIFEKGEEVSFDKYLLIYL